VCRDVGEERHHDSRGSDYWKREFLAYDSGLLGHLPPGVRAPACYGAEELPNGTARIWLEDVRDTFGRPWPLKRYALAACHAGQFNGAYLAGRVLPDVPWLVVGGGLSRFNIVGPDLEKVRALGNHPLLRREWPDETLIDRSVRVWREREIFFAALARLPQTLSHLDFFRLNLFAVSSPGGIDETVAIDWANLGTAAVGQELAPLLCASTIWAGERADQARELGETCFDGYLEGLREAGWKGDRRLVRLGYTAGIIEFCGTLTQWAIADPTFLASIENAWGPFTDFLDRAAVVRPYMLDLTDEARDLMADLW
jgi:hypothetical protein